MHSFDAHYDEEGSARAERAFFVRSARELRPWSTFGLPALLSVVVTVASAMAAPAWFLLSSGLLLVGSVLIPVFSYFTRSRAAAKLARENPVRRVNMSTHALTIIAGGQSAVVEWSRIFRIWRAHGYTLLVVDKFTAISIPDSSIPSGAREFIESVVKDT